MFWPINRVLPKTGNLFNDYVFINENIVTVLKIAGKRVETSM